MAKKRPNSLLEFQRMFPDEDACSAYLWQIRWPDGFFCPHCGSIKNARQEAGRKLLWGCRDCGKQTSLIAGTIMRDTKLPLQYWFWGAYLVASHSNGISALQLWKQLQLGSYKSAWLMLNKLRRAMVDPKRQKLSGLIEVDEAYIPFRRKDDPEVDKRGRSKVGKMAMIVAVEVVEFVSQNGESRTKPGRIRIEPIPDTKRQSLHGFIRRNIEPGSAIVTDNNPAYRGLKDYWLKQINAKKMPASLIVPWADRVISLVKTLALGTYHGYRRRYIRRYLDEFVWRFNRRHYRPATFHMILGLAAQTAPAPLQKILGDPIDSRDGVVALPAPAAAKLKSDMLQRLKSRRYRSRGFLPPEDFPD